jgi:hypothetical protein
MKGETETIERSMAGAKTDREPSPPSPRFVATTHPRPRRSFRAEPGRLAACGTFQPLEYLHALLVVRMLRAGTGRGPTEDNGQARGARTSAIVNRQL